MSEKSEISLSIQKSKTKTQGLFDFKNIIPRGKDEYKASVIWGVG